MSEEDRISGVAWSGLSVAVERRPILSFKDLQRGLGKARAVVRHSSDSPNLMTGDPNKKPEVGAE